MPGCVPPAEGRDPEDVVIVKYRVNEAADVYFHIQNSPPLVEVAAAGLVGACNS